MAEKKKKAITKKAAPKVAAKKSTVKKLTPVKKVSVSKNDSNIELAENITAKADEKKRLDYLYAVGRRKTAIAQVRVYKKGAGDIMVNEKDYKIYFPTNDLQERVMAALKVVGQLQKLSVKAKVSGGGISGQADAVRHGLSRALIQLNQNFRKPLKKAGFLTRDARKKERKKPGLKRARKRPQWQKR